MKPRMTRRVMRRYQAVLRQDENENHGWIWPHPVTLVRRVNPRHVNGVAAELFAQEWYGRAGVDLRRLEGIVARSGHAESIVRFATRVPGANVRRLQRAVMATLDPRAVQAFKRVPGADAARLDGLLLVMDVMGL